MKKVLLSLAVIAAIGMTSCGEESGDDKDKDKEKGASISICDCMSDENAEGCDELKKEWETKYENADEGEKEILMKDMMEEAEKCEESAQ